MRILMIHGRAQGGKSEAELTEVWTAALKKGYAKAGLPFPDNVAIDVPFYGNRLDEITEQFDLPGADSVIAKGLGQNREFEQFMQQTLNEMAQDKQIAAEVKREVEKTDIDEFIEKGIANWGVTQAIVRTLDRYLTGVSDFTIEMFLKDVFLYVNHANVANAINRIVAEKLTGEPTLVVAHSLGSVVAYKMLTDPQYSLNLTGLVTVGCPLGITAISSKLGAIRNPSGNKGWFNAYDERDVVALNALDDRYFPVEPGVVNDNSVDNHTDNRHGIVGYLDDVGVVRRLVEKLG